MAIDQPIPFAFPVRGVHRGAANAGPPDATTNDALNARVYEVAEQRARGGQRPGLVKAFATEIGSGGKIHEIGILSVPKSPLDSGPSNEVVTVTPSTAEGWAANDKIDDNAGDFLDITDALEASPAATASENDKMFLVSASGRLFIRSGDGTTTPHLAYFTRSAELFGAYEIRWKYHGVTGAGLATRSAIPAIGVTGSQNTTAIAFRVKSDYTEGLYFDQLNNWSNSPGAATTFRLRKKVAGVVSAVSDGGSINQDDYLSTALFPCDWVEWRLVVDDDTLTWQIRTSTLTNFVTLYSTTATDLNTNEGVGFFIGNENTVGYYGDLQVLTSEPGPFGRRDVYVVPFTDNRAYVGLLGESSATLSELGSSAGLAATGMITSVALFRKIYALNGETGVKIDPKAATIGAWTATAGTRPEGYIVSAWRGCAVIAGGTDDADAANDVYFSRVGDPDDWDYAATDSAVAAFALSSSDLGRNEDPVVALVPWADDLLLIGGTASIRQITGDPRVGGRIDTVTTGLGMAGPKAWTIANTGEVFFLGQDGLYSMPIGSKNPTNRSAGVLDELLSQIDFSERFVSVTYNAQDHAVHVFITPFDQSLTTHAVLDLRQGGWWLDQFPAVDSLYVYDPIAAVSVFGDAPDLRNVLIGGQDGYVRRFDHDAKSDDSSAIDSYVDIGPTLAYGGLTESKIRELQLVLGNDSDAVAWTLRAGKTAELLNDGTLTGSASGTSTAGLNIHRVSLRAGALSLRLRNATVGEGWQVERALGITTHGGRRR